MTSGLWSVQGTKVKENCLSDSFSLLNTTSEKFQKHLLGTRSFWHCAEHLPTSVDV
jgi:hypothetical protein